MIEEEAMKELTGFQGRQMLKRCRMSETNEHVHKTHNLLDNYAQKSKILFASPQGRHCHEFGELSDQLCVGVRNLHGAGVHGRDEEGGGGGCSQR